LLHHHNNNNNFHFNTLKRQNSWKYHLMMM
jgi:hypothetical protein